MTTDKKETKPPGSTSTPAQRQRPSLTIDVDYYQGIIDDPDVSEDRKRELIEIVGAIVIQFLDLGFGVDSVQLARGEQQKNQPTAKEMLLERSDT